MMVLYTLVLGYMVLASGTLEATSLNKRQNEQQKLLRFPSDEDISSSSPSDASTVFLSEVDKTEKGNVRILKRNANDAKKEKISQGKPNISNSTITQKSVFSKRAEEVIRQQERSFIKEVAHVEPQSSQRILIEKKKFVAKIKEPIIITDYKAPKLPPPAPVPVRRPPAPKPKEPECNIEVDKNGNICDCDCQKARNIQRQNEILNEEREENDLLAEAKAFEQQRQENYNTALAVKSVQNEVRENAKKKKNAEKQSLDNKKKDAKNAKDELDLKLNIAARATPITQGPGGNLQSAMKAVKRLNMPKKEKETDESDTESLQENIAKSKAYYKHFQKEALKNFLDPERNSSSLAYAKDEDKPEMNTATKMAQLRLLPAMQQGLIGTDLASVFANAAR